MGILFKKVQTSSSKIIDLSKLDKAQEKRGKGLCCLGPHDKSLTFRDFIAKVLKTFQKEKFRTFRVDKRNENNEKRGIIVPGEGDET